MSVLGNPVARPITSKRDEFVFSDSVNCGDTVTLPYTREQYLALPRKKKKRVLMSVKSLLKYKATCELIEQLSSLDSKSEKIASRIENLRARQEEERKFLPTSPLWADAVKRVVK